MMISALSCAVAPAVIRREDNAKIIHDRSAFPLSLFLLFNGLSAPLSHIPSLENGSWKSLSEPQLLVEAVGTCHRSKKSGRD